MSKKMFALIAALLTMVLLFAACTPGTPAEQPTAEPVQVTDAPTEEPEVTDTPEPTATPEPKPKLDYSGNAILIDFDDDSCISASCCTYEIRSGEPWLTVLTEAGDNNITFAFDEVFLTEDYPIIAFKYRVGYGQSIRGTNHFYSITGAGGPSVQEGTWADLDFMTDLDWHIGVFHLTEDFPQAASDWSALRCPTVDTVGGDLAFAWFGAFESEEDLAAYDKAFNDVYGEKLVKAEKPKEEKTERVPDVLLDEFENIVLDFEDASDGDLLSGYYAGDEWIGKFGLNSSKFVQEGDSIALNLTFDALYHNSLVKSDKGFTAKFDFRDNGNGSGNFGGFIFGFGDENNDRDFYENAYGKDGVNSLVGKSGIGVTFHGDNKIYIYLRYWNADKSKIDILGAEYEAPVNFNEKMVSFVIDDDGTSKITITADGHLLFTVNYSDPGVVADAVGYYEQYFRNVSITDGAGNEVIKSDQSLLSIYDSFGFGARARDLIIDNIEVVTKK